MDLAASQSRFAVPTSMPRSEGDMTMPRRRRLSLVSGDCRLPKSPLRWKTFYPLADTKLLCRRPRPRLRRFTTIGQWYWGGALEVDGTFPDLSKKFAFEPYLDLPKRIPEARFDMPMQRRSDKSCASDAGF